MDRRVVRSHRLRNRSGRARQGDGRRPGRSALAGGAAAMKRALLALAVSLLAGGSTLAEEDVAAFFHGKTLRLVASASARATTSMRGCLRATWPRISRASRP